MSRFEHDRLAIVLREAREKAGLSQRELAAKIGREQSYVSKVERGIQVVSVSELFDWARACDRKPSEIMRLIED